MSGSLLPAHRPGAALAAGAIAAVTVAVGATGPVSSLALTAGVAGVLALAVGLTRGQRRLTALGTIAALGGVLAAGLAGAGPERLLPGTAGALLAHEFAVGAFAARAELDGGTVDGSEWLHVGVATGASGLALAAGYGLYRTLTVGVSTVGVGLLLVAAVALALATREREAGR